MQLVSTEESLLCSIPLQSVRPAASHAPGSTGPAPSALPANAAAVPAAAHAAVPAHAAELHPDPHGLRPPPKGGQHRLHLPLPARWGRSGRRSHSYMSFWSCILLLKHWRGDITSFLKPTLNQFQIKNYPDLPGPDLDTWDFFWFVKPLLYLWKCQKGTIRFFIAFPPLRKQVLFPLIANNCDIKLA